jgi:hypothetical protein
MSRHPEPEIVTLYRNTLRAEPPRVCHTCDHYSKEGVCVKFNEAPPPEFANEPGGCALWEWEIPF